MKNKIIFVSLAIVLTFSCFFAVVNAATGVLETSQEAITNFHSDISVNVDNSVDVVETITYNTGSQNRHGIYRDIYPYSSTGKKMAIDNVSVTDENNLSYIFTLSNVGANLRIKIGDPNRTFTGQKIYIIKYHATKAVAQFKDFDEIYWNVTGNEWPMPIYVSSASVVLPVGAAMTQSACYYGPKGSTNQCQLSSNKNGIYSFDAPSSLNIGEGLTVALGFPKGVVAAYSSSDNIANFFDAYLGWLIAAILPILTLILSLWYWFKKGRDPKGTGVIIPQYDVPDMLSPMEVAGIVNQKVSSDNISAEIIYLATKGYLKITETESRTLGIFKSTDYELAKLKDSSLLSNGFDKILLNGLFVGDAEVVKLTSLRNTFYITVKQIISAVLDALLNKGYYKNLGRMKNSGGRLFLIFFISFWVSGFFGGIFGSFLFQGNSLPLMAGIFISVVIYAIVSHFFPSKTEKGVAAKEYILGLKDYLQIAEKDRLLFHDAPEKKPEIFENLLPYAMVLGVANIWAKEFEGIYTMPPSWYSGPSNTAFSAIAFSHSLSNFSFFASSSLSSSPSGSGGGGFSGGGGGGGGGGGW
jgi:uncharacterized membrane protein